MKIVLMGDSITDMGRDREDGKPSSYGFGYPFFIEGELSKKYPAKHTVYNKGISGNRIVDVYSRIKCDLLNYEPDLVSILIGINDVWHEICWQNGVELDRFDKIYRMYLSDIKKVLPNVKFMILEPFVLLGKETQENYNKFLEIKKYAEVIKQIAKDYDGFFVPLQEKFNELLKEVSSEYYLYDGVHPSVAGSKIIAEAWLDAFEKYINK